MDNRCSLASLSAVLPANDFEDDTFTAVLSAAAFLDDFPEDPFAAVLVEAPFVDDAFDDNASGSEPSLANGPEFIICSFFRFPMLSSSRLRLKSRFLFVTPYPLVEVFFS